MKFSSSMLVESGHDALATEINYKFCNMVTCCSVF